MARIGNDLAYAIELLKRNEVVAIPTETVYGLAGNGLNEEAITKIFEVKKRPFFDPLILHTSSLKKVQGLLANVPDPLFTLAEKHMPGPLTILFERTEQVPDLITAGSDKVAIRIPSHPITRKLLEQLPFPLAAPSANPFGYISPTKPEHVEKQLGNQIAYILDGGPCKVGLESTIVEWKNGGLRVLRKGGIPVEALGEDVTVEEHSSSNPTAPGMLKSHYSPKVPVMISPDVDDLHKYSLERIAALRFQKLKNTIPLENQLILSKNGDLHEAAQHLFSHMRKLDEMDIDLIIVELVPDEGLGRAINDKLRRAAACD